jgi:TRAP-type C4-dicarboxylate transport system substrate-binding protein
MAPALVAGAVAAVTEDASAQAETAMLRFQHFLPANSPQHTEIFLPWAKRLETASKGRLKVEVSAAMRLGGKPTELLAQVEEGTVADIVWTVTGYTPGRFPRLEVFELPWIASSRASATSRALFEYYQRHARSELESVHVLAVWCHPSGVIMTRERPIAKPGDLSKLAIRAPSELLGQTLTTLGATSRFMPAPAVLESLTARQIDGALFPYEVIPTLKLANSIGHITEFAGHRGLYTAIFIMAMSKRAYAALPADLRAVIDANSGEALSGEFGDKWDEIELTGRDAFAASGGTISFIRGAHYDEWVDAVSPVTQRWLERQVERGIDGNMLLNEARELVAKYTLRARDL